MQKFTSVICNKLCQIEKEIRSSPRVKRNNLTVDQFEQKVNPQSKKPSFPFKKAKCSFLKLTSTGD